MSKIDELKVKISRLENELGITYDNAKFKDEIDSSSTYLLYKYMQLLDLKDNMSVKGDLEGAGKLISHIESRDPDSLSNEEKSLLELKEEINGALSEKNSAIEEVSKKYRCEGEYEKIIWEPNTKYFSTDFLSEHKDELYGILDVNKESVDVLQEENDRFFRDRDDANNESGEEISVSEVEQITLQRVNDNYEVLDVVEMYDQEQGTTEEEIFEEEVLPHESKSSQGITMEEALEVRERLQAHFEGQTLSEEQKETIEELNYLFEMGEYDEYRMLAEAEINNIPVEEEEADPEEIEAMSDELIDQTISRNFVNSIEEEIEEADELGF